MPTWFVTGKLGAGKSLAAVGRIRDYINKGLPVATNLDLYLHNLIGKNPRQCRVYRLPDKPTVDDMWAIGSGNPTYDESKNGLIVLDECGTWFNSRNWQDKSRQPFLDWLLHARKLGWDIIFLVQDISLVDKQAKMSICEHVVYCRRMDRLKYPLIDSVLGLFKTELPKAKIHIGIVKYGTTPTSLTVDRWVYMGKDLYQGYDTKQIFRDSYDSGLYSYLPPWYTHGRYQVKKDWRYFMRITKIYFRRFSKVGMLAAGIVAGSALASYIQQPEPVDEVVQEQPVIPDEQVVTDPALPLPEGTEDEKPMTIAQRFDGYTVTGVAAGPDREPIYVQIGNGESVYNLQSLRASGYVVKMVNQCEVLLMTQDRLDQARLYTTYCPSHDGNVNPPRMSPEQRYRYRLAQMQAEQQSSQ